MPVPPSPNLAATAQTIDCSVGYDDGEYGEEARCGGNEDDDEGDDERDDDERVDGLDVFLVPHNRAMRGEVQEG